MTALVIPFDARAVIIRTLAALNPNCEGCQETAQLRRSCCAFHYFAEPSRIVADANQMYEALAELMPDFGEPCYRADINSQLTEWYQHNPDRFTPLAEHYQGITLYELCLAVEAIQTSVLKTRLEEIGLL